MTDPRICNPPPPPPPPVVHTIEVPEFCLTDPLAAGCEALTPFTARTPDAVSVVDGIATLTFVDPQPGWFDPPYAIGFVYALEGDGSFASVTPPPATFGFGPVDLDVNGQHIARLAPGQLFNFLDANLPDVTVFALRDIGPALDTEAPGFSGAFPTALEFVGAPSRLTMTPILAPPALPPPTPAPEPDSKALVAIGLLCLLLATRRWSALERLRRAKRPD